MDNREFFRMINQNSDKLKSNQLDLKIIVEQYPYFQSALFLYLKSLYLNNDNNFETELCRFSVFINDRKSLFYYIYSEDFAHFFKNKNKKEIAQDRTHILLNAFFDTQENADTFGFMNLDQDLISNTLASSDYFSYLKKIESVDIEHQLEEKVESQLKHHEIIDSFIEKSETGGIHLDLESFSESSTYSNSNSLENTDAEELDEDLFFTETLARIYIKQKKYEKAYKIIKHLSLNYPQKNIYFADQLHFLEKLIINSKYKDKK